MGVGRGRRGDLTPWILDFDNFLSTFLVKQYFSLSFELIKWNFTVASPHLPPWKNPSDAHCRALKVIASQYLLLRSFPLSNRFHPRLHDPQARHFLHCKFWAKKVIAEITCWAVRYLVTYFAIVCLNVVFILTCIRWRPGEIQWKNHEKKNSKQKRWKVRSWNP